MVGNTEKMLKTREVRAFGFIGAEVVRTLTEKLSDLAEEDAQEPIRLALACYGSAWISVKVIESPHRSVLMRRET